MAQIRLDDINAAGLKQTLEVVFCEQTLAGGDGNVAAVGNFPEHFHVFAEHRLFDEHGIKFLQLFCQHFRHRFMYAAMEINGDSEIFPAAFPDGVHAFQHGVNFLIAVDHLQLFGGVHFDGGKTGLLFGQGRGSDVAGTVTADPAVHPHIVPAGAAHELVYRRVEKLALDVPQGLIDSGDGAHQHAAAPVEPGTVKDGGKVLNPHGILADQIGLHLLHAGQNCGAMPFQHRLAPACQTLVGDDLHKSPAGPHGIGADFDYLHKIKPFMLFFTVCRNRPAVD